MQHGVFEDVRIEGHLIDSGIVSQVMDHIIAFGGEFEMLSFEVGRTNTDVSVAVLRVRATDQAHLDGILSDIQSHGAYSVDASDARLAPAPMDGVFPDNFYSTTNMVTDVRIDGSWVRVANPEMDLGVRIDAESGAAEAIPMADVRAGDQYVVGHDGIRVHPQERPRDKQAFEFMSSAVSSEKPKAQVVADVAKMLRDTRAAGKDVIAVVGPAVVHTGAAGELARLVKMGYITVMFGGNAVATHDIESALYGTSLGVGLEDGVPTARRARAPSAGDQRRARLRLHRRRGRAGGRHEGTHVHARDHRHAVRAGRLDPRRRPVARCHHRRHRGAERDALLRAEGGRLPDALDDAALDRDRQHAAGVHDDGVRRHQPRGRHQARRPR